MALTITTYAKYLKLTDSLRYSKRIFYTNMFSIDVDGDNVFFNNHDGQYPKIVLYSFSKNDVDTFDTIAGMSAEQMADAITTKIIA